MIALSTPNVSSVQQSITVTCTIHSDSTADQCVVMAMADGGVNTTGDTHALTYVSNELFLSYYTKLISIPINTTCIRTY